MLRGVVRGLGSKGVGGDNVRQRQPAQSRWTLPESPGHLSPGAVRQSISANPMELSYNGN